MLQQTHGVPDFWNTRAELTCLGNHSKEVLQRLMQHGIPTFLKQVKIVLKLLLKLFE